MARSNPSPTHNKPPPPKTPPTSRSTRIQAKTPAAPKSRSKSSSAPVASGQATPAPRTRGRPRAPKSPVIKEESPEIPPRLQSIPEATKVKIEDEDEDEDEIPARPPPAPRPRAPRPAATPARPRQRPAPYRAVHDVNTRATRRRLREEGRAVRLVELDEKGNEVAQRK